MIQPTIHKYEKLWLKAKPSSPEFPTWIPIWIRVRWRIRFDESRNMKPRHAISALDSEPVAEEGCELTWINSKHPGARKSKEFEAIGSPLSCIHQPQWGDGCDLSWWGHKHSHHFFWVYFETSSVTRHTSQSDHFTVEVVLSPCHCHLLHGHEP